jgi:8-oxo-dGTP pyrophosphatase MutT (NUDIX family)
MKDWDKRLDEKLANADWPLPSDTTVKAAVLIPIGLRYETMRHEILLTKRTDKVETHKGQISFPGGLFEKGDGSLLKTALRETYEEVGIAESAIQVIGKLEPVQTLKDVVIYPWVAKVDFPKEFKFSQDEVERPVFLPLEELIFEGLKPVVVPVSEHGLTFKVSSVGIVAENELIWGASAKILEQLHSILK